MILCSRNYLLLILSVISCQAIAIDNNANSYNGVNFIHNQQATIQLRDPFTTSTLMYEVLGTQSSLNSNVYGFIPNLGNVKVPEMRLRAYISKDDQPPLAILEIKGKGRYMVREGDEINIDPANPRQAIRISKITRLSVTVETGTLGSIRVLR